MRKLELDIQQGKCPKCDGYDLDYDTLELGDLQTVQYPYTCNECGFVGREQYSLAFIGHWDVKNEKFHAFQERTKIMRKPEYNEKNRKYCKICGRLLGLNGKLKPICSKGCKQ